MAGERATTIRFSDSMYQRLERAGEVTGLPINSIVVVACLEWLDAHPPVPGGTIPLGPMAGITYEWPRAARSLLPLGSRKGAVPFDRFSHHAKEALSKAQEEAERRGQSAIDPEHLLLGLLRAQGSLAAEALNHVGIDLAVVEGHVASSPAKGPLQRVVPTPGTKRVIETAFRLAREEQSASVATGHLLLALAMETNGVVAAVFTEKGVTAETIRAEVGQLSRTLGPED